jgi:NAD(P)-dependent dehydrogenase (short-subunit alcohol dehydrogenase family)
MPEFSITNIPDLTGRTSIVTGANGGIGLAVAKVLGRAGSHVVLAVRSPEKGRAAAAAIDGSTEVRQLDLADLDSVRAFAGGWDGEVDLLINNAAASANELTRTADGFELQLGTDHLGHFALTNLLLEHITGRVVTVASQAERMGAIDLDDLNYEHREYKRSGAYGQAKLANLLFSAELQRRLDAAGSGVLAQSAHPGFVATEIYADSGRLAKILVRALAQSPDQGALPVLQAALGDIPGNSFTGPKHLMHMRGAPELIKRSATAQDPELAQRLWARSEELTQTRFPIGAGQHHRSAS